MNEQRKSQGVAFTQPRVVVVGNLTIDDVVLPDGTTRMASPGGNCLYSALGVRLWQPSVGVVTRQGEDFPYDLLALLSSWDIATKGVLKIAGPTVRNWVLYEHDGRRSWIYRTAPERVREVAVQPDDLPAMWLSADPAPVVHVAAMPLDAAEALVDRIRRVAPHAIITLDTHEDYVVAYRSRLLALAARVDAFLPSRSELADLVGYDDPRRALVSLTSLPTPFVVIKMGDNGVLVWDKARATLHSVGVAAGSVVDVTGAGDAFCGGFAAGLSLGYSPLVSAQCGTIAASYAVAGFGSLRLAQVAAVEAQNLLSSNPPTVHLVSASSTSTPAIIAGLDRDVSSSLEAMREEIGTIPTLLEQQFETLAGPLATLAQTLHGAGIEHLYLVGCGDSAFAGAAAALAFQRLTGIDADDALFLKVMAETLERWLRLAEERLRGKGVCLYVMLGNDDEPALREVLAKSSIAVDSEDQAVELGEGFQMLSCGFANPTPWHSSREMPEPDLQFHIEQLVAQLKEPSRAIFNLHVPPIRTAIDIAPAVDENLSPVIQGGSVLMSSGGSEAVRNIIEKYQPLIALHGHIHESRGIVKLGKSVCINPGSAYGEGVLHGAVFELDKRKGLKRYQLTSG